MSLCKIGELSPEVAASEFVAAEATVIGRAVLGEQVSVWPGVVIKAHTGTAVAAGDRNRGSSMTSRRSILKAFGLFGFIAAQLPIAAVAAGSHGDGKPSRLVLLGTKGGAKRT
ncbi:hypothetical protein D3C72_1514800 [compost metagenome]